MRPSGGLDSEFQSIPIDPGSFSGPAIRSQDVATGTPRLIAHPLLPRYGLVTVWLVDLRHLGSTTHFLLSQGSQRCAKGGQQCFDRFASYS